MSTCHEHKPRNSFLNYGCRWNDATTEIADVGVKEFGKHCSSFPVSIRYDFKEVITHFGFLLHFMRPREHLAFMSYTRTPMSLAHATNWPFHLMFCTPPSASYKTVDFSRDKKVFSCRTNRSSPTQKGVMWFYESLIYYESKVIIMYIILTFSLARN
jgi:hypothetical protein